MKKVFAILLLATITFSSFAQDTITKRVVKKFIPLNAYESMVGKITDTTEFMYENGDTRVSVPLDYDPLAGKDVVKVAYQPKDSTFLDVYKNVVYNTAESDDSKDRMRYWKDDIKIYFDESVPASHAKELMQFAEILSKDIDSLNISRNFVREKSNYLVYYLNRENPTDFDPRMNNPKGGYYISWNGKQQIYDAKLKINTELVASDSYQLSLLKYHFFKSLGYFYSSNKLDCSSYLSACNTQRELSDIDLEILNYHYSYGVCKGTNLESFTELTTNMNQRLKEDPNAKLYVVHEK